MLLDHLSQESFTGGALTEKAFAPRGSRIMEILDRFLLDDEQRDILGLESWNIYFMAVSAHLLENGVGSAQIERDDQWEAVDESQVKILTLILGAVERRRDALSLAECHQEYEGQVINLPLISMAIGLAAALDIESPQTVLSVLNHQDEVPRISPDQFIDSVRVKSLTPHPFLPGTIRLRINCSSDAVHRLLKRHETRVQALLHRANQRVSPRFLFSDILFEIEPRGYTPLDMKFSVDSMAALRLLTGNRLYSDSRVFLRELIQNAVDACHLKTIFEPGHQPEIAIQFDPEYRSITFYDNGIGMDRQWIEKYFLRVGISFYQSGDLKTVHKSRMDCHFISKFGIGFLSSFLCADRVTIRTRKNSSPGLVITIHTLEDYFDVRFAENDCPGGTEVTLFLKASNRSFSKSMEYLCYLKNNLRFLTIPVQLTDHRGRTMVLGSERFPYEVENRTGRDFVAPLSFKASEGYLFLKAKENQDTLYGLDYARDRKSVV